MENKVIAVCTTNLSDDTVVERLTILHKEARACGYKIVVVCTTNETSYYNDGCNSDSNIFKDFNYGKCSAVVIFSEVIKNDDILEYIVEQGKKYNIPVISFEKKLDNAVSLMVDYVTSFELLVRHVIFEHNVKRVDFMSGMPDNSFSKEREDVYKKVLAEAGIEYDDKRMGYGYFWEEPCEKAMDKLLDYDTPEAIICANDVMAITACNKLKERGLRVPEDVIVTGFDGLVQGKWNNPTLTTCGADFTVMAQKIMNIIGRVYDKKQVDDVYYVPYQYEVNASCGCKENEHVISPALLFDYYNFNRKTSLYQMNMYQMQGEMAHKDSTMQLASVIHSYMNCNGYIIVNDNIPEFAFGSKNQENKSRDYVRVLVRKQNNDIEIGTVFKREEIVPNFETALSDDEPLVIMPIHSPKESISYLAVNTTLDKLAFTTLVMFNHATGNALDTYKTQKSLKQVNRKLEEVNDRMAEIYVHDPLTNLFNRRGFYNIVPNMMKSCYAKGLEMFVASIDMDDLKMINDTYGHAEGDIAIRTFGNALLVNADKEDVCARFGGDEFVVVGPAKNADEAGSRYIKSVENYLNNYNRDVEKPYKIAASLGVVSVKPEADSFIDEYILKADRIMYQNKKERKAFRSRVRSIKSFEALNDADNT